MKHFISPVARVYVRPKNADDLPKFCDRFKKLAQSDPLAICSFEDTGEYIIAGCSKIHIEIVFRILKMTMHVVSL